MRIKPAIALASALLTLPSCNSTTDPQVVRTTITRPISYGSTALRSPSSLGGVATETVVVEQPYQSPAYQAAGAALFSND